MPYALSYDGVKIFYLAEGSGEEVIILIHGLGENHETWKEQIPFLKNLDFKVLALDLRGHGSSEIPKKKIEMEDFAEDVLAVLKNEGVEKVNCIGYSMGALVVLETYKKRPDIFKKIVLEAFIPQYPPAQTEVLINMSMDEIASQVAEYAVWREAPRELKEDIYRIISQTNKEVYIESAEAATSKSYDSLLYEIEQPTLLIYGQYDFICPPEIGEQVKEKIKNSKFVVIENVGHMPHRENPSKFNSIVKDFLLS